MGRNSASLRGYSASWSAANGSAAVGLCGVKPARTRTERLEIWLRLAVLMPPQSPKKSTVETSVTRMVELIIRLQETTKLSSVAPKRPEKQSLDYQSKSSNKFAKLKPQRQNFPRQPMDTMLKMDMTITKTYGRESRGQKLIIHH